MILLSVSLNYLPSTKVFNAALDITHRLTTEENINEEIVERNIKWFTNVVKWKLGLDNPSRVYKDFTYEFPPARVILMYDLTEDIENAWLLLSKMR